MISWICTRRKQLGSQNSNNNNKNPKPPTKTKPKNPNTPPNTPKPWICSLPIKCSLKNPLLNKSKTPIFILSEGCITFISFWRTCNMLLSRKHCILKFIFFKKPFKNIIFNKLWHWTECKYISRTHHNSMENTKWTSILFSMTDFCGVFVCFCCFSFTLQKFFYRYIFNLEVNSLNFVKHEGKKGSMLFIHPKHHGY